MSVVGVLALLLLPGISSDAGSFGTRQGTATPMDVYQVPYAQLEKELKEAKAELLRLKGGVSKSVLPKISLITLHATPMKTATLLTLPLTVESMRLNPSVSFHIVNIVDPADLNATGVQMLIKVTQGVENIHVHVLTVADFATVVHKQFF